MPACISVYHMHAVPMEARGGYRVLLELEIDSCELPGGCQRGSNLVPLEEQTEPFPKPYFVFLDFVSVFFFPLSFFLFCFFG